MTNFKILIAIFTLSILFSFKTKTLTNTIKTGSYGICSCDDKKDNNTIIELKINADNTF